MDPQFSVLLDDPTAGGDKCKTNKNGNATKKIVEIVVPVVGALALLVAIFVVVWPRYTSNQRVRGGHEITQSGGWEKGGQERKR
jgi:hypothetical protein